MFVVCSSLLLSHRIPTSHAFGMGFQQNFRLDRIKAEILNPILRILDAAILNKIRIMGGIAGPNSFR